jgi:hypothetical protein
MDMHDIKKLKEMLMEELAEYGKGKELTMGSLDMVDKLAHATKNLCKIVESGEEEEYSRADGMGGEGSYRGMYRGSYRGSYADEGGSYRRRRDSMGRYSRDGYSRADEKEDELHDIVDQLRSMAKDLPQPTQRAIQNFTDMVG